MANKKQKLDKTPKVFRSAESPATDFPVNHYSYSSLALFTTNPILFKIRYINREKFNTTRNISGVVGQAFHKAMEVYWCGHEQIKPKDESEAIEFGMKTGMDFLEKYEEGWIEWSKTITNKQKAYDLFTFLFQEYVKSKPWTDKEEVIGAELELKQFIDIEWRGKRLTLPIPLKGYLDKVMRVDGKLKIVDYKTCRSFSDPERIDGKKIIQAIQYYLLVHAYYGEVPYSMVYQEVKYSKNRDGSPQVKEYEIVYEENDLFFDFYFRLYQDVTRALSGESVFVPNVEAIFDNEVAVIAYVHRLDMSDEQAALMKKYKVDNLTDLLKKKIQVGKNMQQLLKSVEKHFVSAKSLNYSSMTNDKKISTKLMEHGMLLQFHDKVEGPSVDLYRYMPSIGLKMTRIRAYAEDVEQVLGRSGVRVLAPIKNSDMVGFEVPKEDRYFPALPEHDGSYKLAVGHTITGEQHRFDFRDGPHMLVAGATGSGKSVFLNSLIEQLAKVEDVELHLFDPKMVELSHYEDIAVEYKHDHKEINDALEFLVLEMEERYEKLRKAKVRNVSDLPEDSRMNYKVVVIDEFGDLVINANVERSVLALAQKARAAGIHLIISTQRPSVDVISGTIKANFPTKAVFRTSKEIDSRVIIDESGAEQLLGKGDMLFVSHTGTERLQGYQV